MNLLEFKLFALKKRNHNFVFEYLDPITHTQFDSKELQVVTTDQVVRVGGTNSALLSTAYQAVLKIVQYQPFTSYCNISWAEVTASAEIRSPRMYTLPDSDLLRTDLQSYLVAGPVCVSANEVGGVNDGQFAPIRTLMHVLDTTAIWTQIDECCLDATGGLSVAKQTQIIDLANLTMEELDVIYDKVLTDGTTMHNLNYFVY